MWKLWHDAAMLGFECQQVMALRMMRLSMGGSAAAAELNRMIGEKVSAAATAGITLAAGGSPEKVIAGYRRTVRANTRRLKKSSRRSR